MTTACELRFIARHQLPYNTADCQSSVPPISLSAVAAAETSFVFLVCVDAASIPVQSVRHYAFLCSVIRKPGCLCRQTIFGGLGRHWAIGGSASAVRIWAISSLVYGGCTMLTNGCNFFTLSCMAPFPGIVDNIYSRVGTGYFESVPGNCVTQKV